MSDWKKTKRYYKLRRDLELSISPKFQGFRDKLNTVRKRALENKVL